MTTQDPWECPLARRRLLRNVGAAGLIAMLGACGRSDPRPVPRGGSSTAPGFAATSPGATAEPGDLPTEEPDAPDGALIAVKDVPVNGGVVTDSGVLVVQPRAGEFRAYEARCPHEGVFVDPPNRSGVIVCPGHLSRFRMTDGSRIDGPAPGGLTTVDVQVIDGYVVER